MRHAAHGSTIATGRRAARIAVDLIEELEVAHVELHRIAPSKARPRRAGAPIVELEHRDPLLPGGIAPSCRRSAIHWFSTR